MHKGRFITFEGGEGSGKSTQARMLAEALRTQGVECVLTREPGGCALSESIRTLLVSQQQGGDWDPVAELLLFMAARVQHVRDVVLPALSRGAVVICDRFQDSTRAYQGIARGLGLAYVDALYRLNLGTLAPDMTFLLDIDPRRGLSRAANRVVEGSADEIRFESLALAFHERLREGFLSLAEREQQRIHVLDATQEVAALHAAVWQRVQSGCA